MITPTPTPTCETDPPSSFDCGNTITWTCDSTGVRFFEIYRFCTSNELSAVSPPLSAFELIDVIYDPATRLYSDFDRPGCKICRYIVGAGNPKHVTYTPVLCAATGIAPSCTPTPTPTDDCVPWGPFAIGDPGVRYVRVLSNQFRDAVKYVKCVDVDDERYPPIIPPTPPLHPPRPYCFTPTPTPTPTPTISQTPTPTPTPTVTPPPTPTPTITVTPGPTPTPTPTPTFDGYVLSGACCISFAEARFSDNDYINAWYVDQNTGVKDEFFCKKLLVPDPGLIYCLPMQVGDVFEVTLQAESIGIYTPCTINVLYDGNILIPDIFLQKDETYKFKVYRSH